MPNHIMPNPIMFEQSIIDEIMDGYEIVESKYDLGMEEMLVLEELINLVQDDGEWA